MLVMATAGHVDHGKSTLVRALTGTDPDRFEEEKRRGLTIDLGFAELVTPGGRSIAFVDVPGHVRFVGNMLAGVGAVTAALFVVDAREGWKPQSEEHLRILDLVGVTEGVVALTKVAGVDEVDAVRADVDARLAGSGLAGVPIVAVDAVEGIGLDALLAELDAVAARPRQVPEGRARLWVDRAFTIRGAGTVVTGTLTGGRLRRGDEVLVGDRLARIRGLQSFGVDREDAAPGARVAVNLAGVDHHDVHRGEALVHPGWWHATRVLDATVTVLPGARPVSRRGALALHVGSGEHAIRVRVLGGSSVATEGLVRIDLPVALPLVPGDRFVLRDLGRGETVGGGRVLDVDPVVPVSRARPDGTVARVVADRGWVRADDLERRTGDRLAATVGEWVVDPDALAAACRALLDRVAGSGSSGLDLAALDERERALLATTDLVVLDGRVHPPTHTDHLADHPYLAALAAAPFDPPAPDLDPGELRTLVRRGLVVQHDGVAFAASAVAEAAAVVGRLLAASPAGVTASEVRQALGTSRRVALPLLGILDERGITSRRGDVRIAGPAMSSPPAAGLH